MPSTQYQSSYMIPFEDTEMALLSNIVLNSSQKCKNKHILVVLKVASECFSPDCGISLFFHSIQASVFASFNLSSIHPPPTTFQVQLPPPRLGGLELSTRSLPRGGEEDPVQGLWHQVCHHRPGESR